MSTELRRQLEVFEGRRQFVYQDKLGFWTIGVGRCVDQRKGGGLRDSEIDFMLSNDIEEVTRQALEALPWFSSLDEPRQAVILGMLFQLGFGGTMGFTHALGSMRDQRWADAAEALRQSRWAEQTPDRVSLLAKQMEMGTWQA